MMILFLNVNSSMIELYGEEGIVRIPFRDAGEIYNHIEEKNVLYITNAVKTGPTEVINMIRGMGVAVQEQNIPVDTGMKYLYSSDKGIIHINEFLKFEGEFDIKLIDEAMTQVIESSMLLQQLIKNKKIQIIGEIKRRKLMKNYKSHQEVMLERQKKIDDSLDSIIVSTSVEQAVENGIVNTEHESAPEINILSGGSSADSGGMKTMSELMNEIEG